MAGTRKLTDEQVETLRRLWESGRYAQSALARRYGITQSRVSQLVRGGERLSEPLVRCSHGLEASHGDR